MKKIEIDWFTVGIIAFIALIITLPIFASIKQQNDTYKELLSNIDAKKWIEAKENITQLGDYKNTSELSKKVFYHYYKDSADKKIKNKDYHQALSDYKTALNNNSEDKNLELKIKEVEQICKKLDEEEKRKQEIARKKAEQERLREERNKPNVNNLIIISQGFGYSQYGEKAVVGKIKNNNSKEVFARADIDLLDSYGNIVGDTYTYDRIPAYGIWNFEAPTFGAYASKMRIHLSID